MIYLFQVILLSLVLGTILYWIIKILIHEFPLSIESIQIQQLEDCITQLTRANKALQKTKKQLIKLKEDICKTHMSYIEDSIDYNNSMIESMEAKIDYIKSTTKNQEIFY
jgi:septal ring factor EnvC (AmiA/AmiB activator)